MDTNLEPANNLQQEQLTRTDSVQLKNGEVHQRGELWRRLMARIFDAVIVGWPLGIIFSLGGDGEWWRGVFWTGLSDWELLLASLVSAAVFAIYEIWLLTTRGQTLGKMATGVKVVNLSDGSLPKFTVLFLRWVPFGIPGMVASLSDGWEWLEGITAIFLLFVLLVTLSPLFDLKHRGWHDKFANTVVIRA